ncbi:MAG: protein translocase subunit SecF [Thermotogae bacterium]|nr:protein translocase subunit SecF [Thermotogota bacterium]
MKKDKNNNKKEERKTINGRPLIDFIGHRKFFISISLTLIAISIIFFFARGFNLGIDFKGGTEVIVCMDRIPNRSVTIGEIRSALTTIRPEYKRAKINELKPLAGGSSGRQRFSIVIRDVLSTVDQKTDFEKHIVEVFNTKISPKLNTTIEGFNIVGGFAASDLKKSAFWAAIIGTILLLIYITIRFEFIFGVGAILALVHDVIITLGIFSLFYIEVNSPIIAAILTLMGYSLNDTIVVFVRIRENMRRMRGKPYGEIINLSINQVLSRTINTSFTTFLTVFVLLLFAGSVLKPFAFALTIGTVVGTYSSMYIASPILLGWLQRARVKHARR